MTSETGCGLVVGAGKDVDSGMGSKIGIKLEVDMVLGSGLRSTKEMEKE